MKKLKMVPKISTPKKNQAGFTLVELMLYVALVSIILGGLVTLLWNAIYSNIKSRSQQEVGANIRLAAQRISYEIRNAQSVRSVGASELCLEATQPAYDPVRIYLDADRVSIGWGGGSTDCTGLTQSEPLTNNLVHVTNLSFSDNTPVDDTTVNISFSLDVEARNSDGRADFAYQDSYQSSVELRTHNSP